MQNFCHMHDNNYGNVLSATNQEVKLFTVNPSDPVSASLLMESSIQS